MSYEETEFDRRLANIVRIGSVAAVDLASDPPSIQVDIGTDEEPHLTAWLPWMTRRAGRTRKWSPPDVNEQVVILSPGGELAQGVVVPGAIFSTLFPANGTAQDLERTTYPDGSVVEYDSATHHLTVTVGTGQVTVNCDTATVNAATKVEMATPLVHCTQNLVVDGTALVKQQLTGQGGMAISGGTGATVAGNMAITGGNVSTDGDVTAGTISLKHHGHTDPQGGNVGPPT